MTHPLPVQQQTAATQRFAFVDNIRWALIVLVICHHSAVTYSHVGSWYYLDGPKPGMVATAAFASLETFDQAFFMGFLFLIAGYFVPRAFDRKGAVQFLRDRATRLGLPALLFMLVIHPFTVYWLLRNFDDPSIPPLSQAYLPFLTSGRVLSASGPMWFALALLLFCIGYASFRLVADRWAKRSPAGPEALPGTSEIAGFILLLGLCTFVVRITQPIGSSILNMQLCYFSQYVLMFAIGIRAYRRNWLLRIPYRFGLSWLKSALWFGVPAWFALLAASGALAGSAASLLGGWHWQSAAFSLWEAFFCVGVCLGFTVLFRDRWNYQGRLTAFLSSNSFAAYVFHTPILVAITLGLKDWAAPIGAKFALACLLAVPATFLACGLAIRRLPGLRQMLG